MSQIQESKNGPSNGRRPRLGNMRSITLDESTGDELGHSVQPLTHSDANQLLNWQQTRSVYAPKSVPNRPKYKFSLQANKSGSTYVAPNAFPAPGGQLEKSSLPECGVCFDEFEDEGLKVPRSLICGHSYCTGCISTLLTKCSKPFLSCPKCNTPTEVKNKDVTNLSKNFSLMDVIRESLGSSSEHLSSPGSRARSTSPVQDPNTGFMRCDEHNGDNLSHFCTVCSKLVCSSCLLYGKHREHNSKTMFVNEAADLYRKKVSDLMPEVRNQHGRMEVALEKVKRMNECVQEKGGQLIDEAEETFGELIGLIEARRDAFKLDVMERTQVRVEALTDQARDLRECIQKAEGVQINTSQLLKMNDYSMLENVSLTMDMIEGVFTNPPQSTPRAQDDLVCEFSDSPREEIASNLSAYGKVRPDVGTISNLFVKPYHDGFSIQWDGHNFIDNEGTIYYLQKAEGDEDFRPLYRGSATKYQYKDDLKQGVPYRFRVQVRTMENFGNWTTPTEALKVAPDFRWHESWRNVKVELCRHKMEAGWTKGGSHNFWASFAGDRPLARGKQHYCEIEILEISKSKSLKKLGVGVISLRKSRAPSTLPWQDGKYPVGQWETASWGFQPLLGVVHSQDTPIEGKQYCSESTLQQSDRIGILVDFTAGTISYFINGRDLGVAFENIEEENVLLCVSLRDKMSVLLRFPPPPYYKRKVGLTKLSSMGH